MTKRGKLTKKDFVAVKKLLGYLKPSEVIRLTGFSQTTIQTFSKLDSWEEYEQFKKERADLFRKQRRAKKLAKQTPDIKVERIEYRAKELDDNQEGLTTTDYFLREILLENRKTNKLLEELLAKTNKKGIFG